MTLIASPVAKISYAAFQALLAQQSWAFWSIDSPTLEPLIAHHPVSLSKLVRVLKSHYTFSDLYLFKPFSTETELAALHWRQLPQVDAETAAPYIIAQAPGRPFFGIAGSLDAAQQGAIILVIAAENEMP